MTDDSHPGLFESVRGPAALATLVAVAGLLACSSSSPRPPEPGTCVPTAHTPCSVSPAVGGGSSTGTGDAGVGETVPTGEGGSCAGASAIYSASVSCASCVAASCCSTGTSCPNDPSCTTIAVCVVTSCLPNDPSCLPTCEAASATNTITEYVDFEQCVGSNCPGCPNGAADM
jgi:hypothetical protein